MMKVRTITAFTRLLTPVNSEDDTSVVQQVAPCLEFLREQQLALEGVGFEVQTLRLALQNPLEWLVDATML